MFTRKKSRFENKWPMLSQEKNGRWFYKSIMNPYWQILENSSMSVTDCWKIHPSFFVVFSFYKILWHELDRLQIWTSFPEMGHFSTKCSILDEFSRNRSSSCPGNLPIRVNWNDRTNFVGYFYFGRTLILKNKITDM